MTRTITVGDKVDLHLGCTVVSSYNSILRPSIGSYEDVSESNRRVSGTVYKVPEGDPGNYHSEITILVDGFDSPVEILWSGLIYDSRLGIDGQSQLRFVRSGMTEEDILDEYSID